MKMRMGITIAIAALAATILTACFAAPGADNATTQTPAAGATAAGGRGQGQAKWMDQLTEEQQKQLQAKVKEMKGAGATPEEIRAAVTELLKGWGIERPGRGGQGGPGGGAIMEKLTAEQREQLLAKVKELKDAGAKPEEIRAAVNELLKGWGIERPGRGGQGGPGGGALMEKLTAEQREQVQAKIMEMRAAGAKPEEIKAAVAEMLKGWGIEMPARGQGPGAGKGFGAQLTEEQRTQLQAKIKEMKAAGAKPEEIKAAVAELFKGWGLEPPQGRGQGQGPGMGQGGGKMQELMQKLTPEQRQELRAKLKEMREAGKSREEIAAAVAEMLKGWGMEAPK